MIAGYDAKHDPRTPILSPEEKKVFVDTFTKTGFTGGINWYRNLSRNWQRSAAPITWSGAVADDHGRKRCGAATVGGRGMEKTFRISRNIWCRDSGHWTQQEKPEEVSAKLIEWRRRRFG